MQWSIPLAALLIVLLLTGKARPRKPAAYPRHAPLEDALLAHLKECAREENGRKSISLRMPPRLADRMERAIAALYSAPVEELLPSARFLCENTRFLQQEVLELCMPGRPLPAAHSGMPRVQVFARELISHCTADFSSRLLTEAVQAWEHAHPMTEDELTALPQVLRMELMTLLCDLASVSAADQQASQAAQQVHSLMTQGRVRRAQRILRGFARHPAFCERLLSLDEGEAWVAEALREAPTELVSSEHAHQESLSRWTLGAIASLRTLRHLPWHRMREELSDLHAVYLQDPVYADMDLESRAAYRARTAHIARNVRQAEHQVAAEVLTLSQSAAPGDVEAHVGYFLLDDGYPALLERLGAPWGTRIAQACKRHACGLFRLSSWFVFAGALAGCYFLHLSPIFWIPVAIVFTYALQQLFLRLLHMQPRPVPRLRVKRLSPECQTLVVCPTMLTSAQHALQMVKKLSILHEANPDDHLHFLLLGDFQDALTATATSDAEIISTAACAVEALCEATEHPFFYLQRERMYTPGEGTHHSRERKRGGVETVLRLVEGQSPRDSFAFASADVESFRGAYRYVIVLDSDTLLPPGSALRMVGAMLHPLNQRRQHKRRMRGFSVLQPRMETAAHTVQTPLSALLGGTGGSCPYNTLTQDVDHDLFGRGTFMGKGIVDPAAFLSATERSIPDGLVLSHDLLEGELSGSAWAGDILLYDGHPQTLQGFLSRLHRWTRGDWQLLPFLLPLFPAHRVPRTRLSVVSRFKLWRNLFRSLVAPMRLVLLLYAIITGRGWLWLGTLLLPELPWLARSKRSWLSLALRLAVLPCEAITQLDAILRTLYRLWISHTHLQEWTPSAQLSTNGKHPPMMVFSVLMASAGVAGVTLILPNAAHLAALFSAVLWAGFAFTLPFFEQPRQRCKPPTRYMREVLTRIARHTLTFFETAITDEDHDLPPDNVQIDPNCGIAHRTSPTNIGLYLCSLIACEKLKLLDAAEAAVRMERTAATLEVLPKWRGMPYNWYDTRSLAPLKPAFVSSVDSGNLCVCLLTCAQGLRALLPKLPQRFHALPARLDALAHAMELEALFDPAAELFCIGFDTDSSAFTPSHYDLLASESRLLSYAAIMLDRVPVRHWHRLGRRFTQARALLSSGGTMFEYLMPVLFQPLVQGTLLDFSTKAAVRSQRKHRLGGAFGVSESGYYAFDESLQYQYRAFGLPALSLNADCEADVLAPYASVLALTTDPKAAFANVLRMQVLGLEGPLGLFEAADFSPERTDGERMRIVRSHMAHHQGMILCAICNFLESDYIAHLFSDLPRAQAYRLLLEERPDTACPAPIRHPFKRRPAAQWQPPMLMSRDAAPLQFPMDAHLLSGGGTTWLIDAQGGGYLQAGGLMLSRFRESCTQPSGMRIYLRDSQSGAYWLASDPYLMHSIRFETAQAVFCHKRHDVACELRQWVNPLDGSAIHCLTLENEAPADRLMEICSYMEPSLLPREDDQAHPAFHDLFLRTKRIGKCAVAAIRRPKHADETEQQLWQLLFSEAECSLVRIQTDRASFLGRGRSFHAPRALEWPISAVADRLGDVVEPCMSLRGQFTLPAKGTLRLFFVTHSARPNENASSFLKRYDSDQAILRTYDSALTSALVAVRFFRLSPAMQSLLSRFTGALAYADQPIPRTPCPLPRQALWRLGLSGSRPICLLECDDLPECALLDAFVTAHAVHHAKGMACDWVIHITQGRNAAAVREQVEEAIQRCHRRENLFVLEGIEAPLLSLLRAAARLALHASIPLEEQLDHGKRSARARPLYTTRSSTTWNSRLPPAEAVGLANGYGGFTRDGRYQIELPAGAQTPAPWCHPLCSEHFGTLCSESGLLFTYAGSSQLGRMTHWPNDSVSPRGDETFFLRDKAHQLLWSLTRQPLGHGMPVRITYGPGEAAYESSAYGIYARLLCFTDMERPVGLRSLFLKNEDQAERTLTLMHTCSFSTMTCLARKGSLLYGYDPQTEKHVALCAVDPSRCECAVMPSGLFQGVWSNAPLALTFMEKLPLWEGNAAILSFTVHLLPGESCTITTGIACAESESELEEQLAAIRQEGASQRLLQVRRFWENHLGRLQFDLPDPALSVLLNRWLPYQVQTAHLWMRGGFYQTGGAIGFRDQLQSLLSQLPTQPEAVRAHLLLCAAHQFEEGDVQHWWHPPKMGVRTRISDDKLFLPFVASCYVEASGDTNVLDEVIPYLHAKPLQADERDRYFEPDVSAVCESLRQHCLRAIDSVAYGAHDLPLIQGGDWCDGFDEAGGENGESVWLGMFLCEVLRRFAPLCDTDDTKRLLDRRARLLAVLDKYAWDGEWYLRAWYDDGEPMGGSRSEECRIDLIAQSWAVMCGVSRDRCAIAMESAWQMLFEPETGVMKLFTPPFQGEEKPGYVAGYLPGVRENGGQYTHAACWAVAALHQIGQDERSWRLALSLLPTTHSASRQLAARYRVEPYVLAADVYANPQQRGRGGWTWYTASAGWYLTVVVQQLLGLRKQGDSLRFCPVAPDGWEQLRITYRCGSATYHLHAARDIAAVTLDGEALPEALIPLRDDGRIHEAFVPLR